MFRREYCAGRRPTLLPDSDAILTPQMDTRGSGSPILRYLASPSPLRRTPVGNGTFPSVHLDAWSARFWVG